MSYYNRNTTDTHLLLPTGAALISVAFWALVFALAFPWESIPTPEVCSNVPIYKGILGRIDGYRLDCQPDLTLRNWVAFAAVAWTLGITALITRKVVVESDA